MVGQVETPVGQNIGSATIKVVGVGGGGSNAVSRMYRDRIPEVEYITVNTDAQALSRSDVPIRIRVGDRTARGLGVGGDPAKGRECHEEVRDEIKRALEGADLVFIAAGMGGGTGTGGSPVVAEIAQELGALTVAVVTKPFDFEGSRRRRQADEGIATLSEVVDTLIVIPNDRLLIMSSENLSMDMAFRMADDVLRQGVQSIAELILVPGEINLDFADVKAIMSNAGPAWMAIGHGSGENRAVMAAGAAGRRGPTCSANTDDCALAPCQNGGVCTDAVASFTCDCAGTGFEGATCQTTTDDCTGAPCQHRGPCVPWGHRYTCHCAAPRHQTLLRPLSVPFVIDQAGYPSP